MFLLDANACIQVLNGTSPALIARLRRHPPAQIVLSSIVKAELLFGALNSARDRQNMALLRRFFAPFASLPFDDLCAERYGVLRTLLRRSGTPIGANDMLIAATALAYDLVLVTHNGREFSRVAGLRLEDWEAEP